MAQVKAVQPVADRRPVDRHAMRLLQFQPQLVQRQVALFGQPGPRPAAQIGEFPAPRIALTLRLQPARLAPQLDHLIYEFRRNPEMPRRLAMRLPFINEGYNPLPQLKWMWLAHD